MSSPRVKALAPSPAPSVPPSWRFLSFAGLRFSVPANWPVERTETWNLCGPVDIVSAQGVTLDTDKTFLALPCPAPLPFPVMPSDGMRVDSTVPGRAKPVFVSIGLAGSGMVARTILYSLRVV